MHVRPVASVRGHNTDSRWPVLLLHKKLLSLFDFERGKYLQYSRERCDRISDHFLPLKGRKCVTIFPLVETDIPVIIVCINVMFIFGKLTDGIKKWFGLIEILSDKIGISLMKF